MYQHNFGNSTCQIFSVPLAAKTITNLVCRLVTETVLVSRRTGILEEKICGRISGDNFWWISRSKPATLIIPVLNIFSILSYRQIQIVGRVWGWLSCRGFRYRRSVFAFAHFLSS